MAFNFNWSPLTADADFYARARDLLTKALNKSPKPPIIVDDILVSEFNLGTVPPDLEILEIGDLAEDRFRGIFKMCYTGDAYLTLRTRVQANPLNTYLHSKPSFTSPKPLAAASGLTIPLSITLSEIKLSAFIILVFSKQKGLTLVFRNDPLESLKVSSTVDSIQFVRDYLQRTIEQQLRNLMMDELPAIIHRLSLQLWCPDQVVNDTDETDNDVNDKGIDPFANPPEDAVDANGNLMDSNALSELTLNGGGEMQSLFSQKNLLRLAALTDSHRTLSLFTPGIRDVVFRAWSGPFSPFGDRSDAHTAAIGSPSLSRTNTMPAGGSSTTYTFSDAGSSCPGYIPSRPSLVSLQSAGPGLAFAHGPRTRPGRKKKTRVVNLRRSKSRGDADTATETTSETASMDLPFSEPLASDSIPEEPEPEAALSDIVTPGTVRFTSDDKKNPAVAARHHHLMSELKLDPTVESGLAAKVNQALASEKAPEQAPKRPAGSERSDASDTSSVIREQAWIMKMADEIARRVYDEKNGKGGTPGASSTPWDEQSDAPPPAYEATEH